MEVVLPQGLAASRAFFLKLDGLLDALGAEDMATFCCRRLHQLVKAHRASEIRFLWNHHLSRLLANLHRIVRLPRRKHTVIVEQKL